MSSDDEIDYMSEEFLVACVGSKSSNDIRPGLTHTHSNKRKLEIEKNKNKKDEINRKKMRPIKEIQEEKLKEGLSKALDESNKGFAMMTKMGFKPGTSLGKGGGIIEPVRVEFKSDRVGLGWKQLIKEKREKIRKANIEKRKEFDPLAYRTRIINKHHEKLIITDLRKSRKVCFDLDSKEGIIDASEYWFWPEYTWSLDEEEEDDDDDDEENIVGKTSTSHADSSEDQFQDNYSEDKIYKAGAELDDIFEPSEQLQILTAYLRSTYMYCVWCCTAYDGIVDLQENCPGCTRSDHE